MPIIIDADELRDNVPYTLVSGKYCGTITLHGVEWARESVPRAYAEAKMKQLREAGKWTS